MKYKNILLIPLVTTVLFVCNSTAFAFTNADIFEAIISAHQNESRRSGLDYISKVEQAPGTYNTWNMLFRVQIKDVKTRKKKIFGVPTTLKYAGNELYIKTHSADVDRRVLDVVLDDVEGTLEDLKDYHGSDLDGFKSNIGHNGKHMILEGHINIAGKSLKDVRNIIVDLRDEMAGLYEELYEANNDALEDYFKDVLAKKYVEVPDVQTFVEIIGQDFTAKNQVKQRMTKLGDWIWKVQGIDVETMNLGHRFEEIIQLPTGNGISQYKTEKMYDELSKRIRVRLPKGAKTFEVRASPRKAGITNIVLQYPYSKKTKGKDIREFHQKFSEYVTTIYPAIMKIVQQYVQAPEQQKVQSLSVEEFMALINDGLESLPVHDAEGALGQWKFKYKGVAYIITNDKKHMMLSFIFTLPNSNQFEDAVALMEDEIEENYPTFADKYGVGAYRSSQRTLRVDMNINYGVLSSSHITGKKIKEKYDVFTQRIAPALQAKLKELVHM